MQIDIADRIITRYANPGELVLVPFAGLFTVPIQAVRLKQKWYGIELNPDYFRDGVGYLENAESEGNVYALFDFIKQLDIQEGGTNVKPKDVGDMEYYTKWTAKVERLADS